MAKQTNLLLRTQTIYQVFPRQHSKTKDFKGIINDLDRIKSLGVDVIYLLPIHPIGKKARKGSQGSPYSIVNYLEVHEDLGSMDDFDELVHEIHLRGMKVMMDIVFNHTSRDSDLVNEHPDWFYRKPNGELANRVGDWSDITDQINPNIIWLSESVHPGFIKYLRDLGFECSSDAEMYQAFDILYDYDIFDEMDHYLKDTKKLTYWMDSVERQETTYPKNYIKLRSFENHDQARLRSKTRDEEHFIQMVSLSFFLKGTAFIYAGMEHQVTKHPSLFEYDLVPWNSEKSLESLFSRLALFKKQPIFAYGNFHFHQKEDVVVASYQYQHQFVLGIFNLEAQSEVIVPLIDGIYTNFIDESEVVVHQQKIILSDKPIIIDTLKEHIR